MSIADRIYTNLKDRIFTGNIKPGNRLFEAEVASNYQASRTPVREAFRRLEQDFLVERIAQGGVRIPEIDMASVEDLFNLRSVLESYAIELACERITPEQVTLLRQIRAQAFELLKLETVNNEYVLRQFVELNSQFHDTIYRATGSKFLVRAINNLREIVLSMRVMSVQADNACHQSWEEHSLLIDYLSRGDKTAALSLIKIHISNAHSQLKIVYQKSVKKNSDEKGIA
jgi:DNA-binding GntR family transcriptional regulator